MSDKKIINRREFLKAAGVASFGSVIASAGGITCSKDSNSVDCNSKKEIKEKLPRVTRRTLGKTGVKVASLAIGVSFNASENQITLRQSLPWGVNYWDTAYAYSGGNAELGIGKYLSKNPRRREELFIVSKASKAKSVNEVEKRLQESLKRMNTEYIDLYYGVHGLTDPEQLTNELKLWSREAKKRKLIKFFGFSTHTNMEKCLAGAAKLDWIDAIMTSYNFRLMQKDEMQAAIDACHKAGIGLIAMKVQGAGLKPEKTEEDRKLTEYFLKKGFTEGQAKIKAVLEDKRISAVCLGMNNVSLLMQNIAAVLDKTKLSEDDMKALKQHAHSTCSGYCAGCGEICTAAAPEMPYISNIMRYLMYCNNYGERDRARKLFARIPKNIRSKLLSIDYSLAQMRCPQKLPIAKLMEEAVIKLS